MKHTIISWGKGVQSTTLGVMAALGDLPGFKVDAIVSSELHWERAATYEAQEFYTKFYQDHGLPVYIVDGGDIREKGAREHVHMPFWTADGGPLRRQCTREFKIRAVRRFTRELFNLPKTPEPGSVETLIGFSLDEWTRMKQSDVQFNVNRWPFIYNLRMTRWDCIKYLEDHGLPVPVKSACIGCPYRQASEYLDMASSEISEAISFDEENRHNPLKSDGSTASSLYIYTHGRPYPLRDRDLERDADEERRNTAFQIPMLCEEGFCHV